MSEWLKTLRTTLLFLISTGLLRLSIYVPISVSSPTTLCPALSQVCDFLRRSRPRDGGTYRWTCRTRLDINVAVPDRGRLFKVRVKKKQSLFSTSIDVP